MGVVAGFPPDLMGSFAFIHLITLDDKNVALVPVIWVCPICKAERGTGANFCRLCGAYLKVVLE